MHGILEISVLGGVAVRRGGSPVAAVPLRAIGLLAYLAVNADIPQSRPHLAGMFWPDSSDAQARTNLRRELHQLRGLLDGDACLVVDASTLAWRSTDTCRVDVCRLALERDAALDAQSRGDVDALARHCEAALAEYRGPLLTGWYDDWVLAARDVLHRQCIDLCDRAVRAAKEAWQGSRRGSWALLLARRRIQLAPFEEPGYRELMDLQALSGDRAGAMTTYHRCASVLEQELGVSPSEATSRAIEDIIGDPGLVVGDAGSMPARVASRATGRPSLIGRDDELAELQSRWARAAAGNPGLAIVSGEAGVGKSRLVAELARVSAKHGALVATARCFGASGGLALAPVADWLRSPQLRASRTSLEPVWREEVDRLVPHPSTGVGGSAASRAKVDAWQRLRFFEGLGRAALAAERPTLLVLDDLQWCDNDTMLWLSFLFGLEPRAPLLVACSARGEELADNRDVYASLRSLRSAGLVMELELGPLAPAETARVAAQMTGDWLSAADVALLQSATGGYPLYVVEAIRAQPTGGAAAALTDRDVNRVLHDRLANLSDAARAITGLAAAIGRDFSLELLSQASDLDADSVVRAVDELWRLRILRQAGPSYDFSHELLRQAAYADLPPAQQWLHHRRLAQAIEVVNAGRLDDVAAQLADHYARSGLADRAMPFYARAAEVATGVYAHAEAIRLLRLSLGLLEHLPPGKDRDLRELDLLQAISAPLNARSGYAATELEETFTRSVELAERLGRPQIHLANLVGLWASRFVQGDIAGSYQLAARALGLAEQVPELAGQAHFAVAGSLLSLGSPGRAVGHFDLARDLSVGALSLTVGTRPEVHAEAWSAHARWLLGDDEGAARARAESLARAREVHHPYTLAVALAYAAITHQMADEPDALDEVLDELTKLCARYDLAYYREWAVVLSGWRLGGAEGITAMRFGLARLTEEHALSRMPYWLSLLAEVHQRQGDTQAMRAAVDAAQVAALQHDDRWWLPEVLRQSASLQPSDVSAKTLQRAAAMATEQTSVALLRRCQVDLDRLGVRETSPADAVRRMQPNA